MPNESNDPADNATNAAQKKAAELSVDLDEVQGTGQEGAILVSDVERAAAEGKGANAHLVTTAPAFGPGEYVVVTGYDDDGEEERHVFSSGLHTPVGDGVYEQLAKDDDGSLSYPLVEVKDDE